jgi:hypothetical protein
MAEEIYSKFEKYDWEADEAFKVQIPIGVLIK